MVFRTTARKVVYEETAALASKALRNRTSADAAKSTLDTKWPQSMFSTMSPKDGRVPSTSKTSPSTKTDGKARMPQELMQVRAAARYLGVHENTVRRWEEAGLIRAIRLPSGVRRFRRDDVERLRAGIYEEGAFDAAAQAAQDSAAHERETHG